MNKKKQNQNGVWLSKEEYIQQLASASNEVHITNKNSKTGSLCNDVAFPTCTCREDAPCKNGGCYCMKGTQQFANVLAAYTRNLRIYNTDAADFWHQVEYKIKHNPAPLFRFFDAGDIPSYEFFCGMVEIAKKLPDIKFLSYTKQYDFVNTWMDNNGELPENLTIRFSAWDKNWNVPNPHNLPVAYVDFKDSSMNPVFPESVSGCPNQKDKTITCSVCRKCWNKNVHAVKFIQH